MMQIPIIAAIFLTVVPVARGAAPQSAATDSDEAHSIANVPPLSWGSDRETTFAGALAAALAPTAQAADYAGIMGSTALAFRTRWYAGKADNPFPGCAPVGEMPEEYAFAAHALNIHLKTVWWDPDKDAAKKENLRRQIMDSLRANHPVLCYIKPHLDCAIIYGYQDAGGTFLVHDYYGDTLGRQPLVSLSPWLCFVSTKPGPRPANSEMVRGALEAAVKNFSRTDHPQFGWSGHFLYGKEAFAAWRAEIAGLDDPKHQPKMTGFPSWWVFNALADARHAAVAYLHKNAHALGDGARPHLLKAAACYEQERKLAGGCFASKDAFLGPWARKSSADWTPAVRRREVELLTEFERLEQRAIGELEAGLAARDVR